MDFREMIDVLPMRTHGLLGKTDMDRMNLVGEDRPQEYFLITIPGERQPLQQLYKTDRTNIEAQRLT